MGTGSRSAFVCEGLMAGTTAERVICKGPHDALETEAHITLRVICVPQAGMGAWAFHGWQAHMPAGVEVMPVEMRAPDYPLRILCSRRSRASTHAPA